MNYDKRTKHKSTTKRVKDNSRSDQADGDIQAISKMLSDNPRNNLLFVNEDNQPKEDLAFMYASYDSVGPSFKKNKA